MKNRSRGVATSLALLLLAPTYSLADNASLRWEFATPGALPQAIAVDTRSPQYAYVALKEGGVAVLHMHANGAHQVWRIPKTQLRNLDAMNLYLDGHKLYVALGNFFTAKAYAGMAIIDVRKPKRPRLMSTWRSSEKLRGSAVVVANKRRAYLGGMSQGVYVLDVQDPSVIKRVSSFQPDVNFPRRNPNDIQHPNARGLALRGSLLYVAYDAGGLRVLNVATDSLSEVSRYINPRMIGKQQAYNNIVLDGKRAFVAIDYAGVEIVDISNPSSIRQLGWWNPWDADTLKNLWINSPGHTNQLCFDPKNQLLYLSAGDSELQVLDVARSKSPQFAFSYGGSRNGQGAWGVARSKDEIYLAYIKAAIPFRGTWSGIKALSTGGIANRLNRAAPN